MKRIVFLSILLLSVAFNSNASFAFEADTDNDNVEISINDNYCDHGFFVAYVANTMNFDFCVSDVLHYRNANDLRRIESPIFNIDACISSDYWRKYRRYNIKSSITKENFHIKRFNLPLLVPLCNRHI